jgi:ribonuclease-3
MAVIFDISGCESKIGYSFKNKILLRTCFTHASYGNEHGERDNELLEFFGDSIMEFVVTEYLYKNSMGNEGKMTQIRAELVSKEPLLRIVKKMGLGEFVLLGNGQGKSANQDEKLYSSIYEALVAGIYLDGGMTAVKKFIKDTLIADYEQRAKSQKKPKTRCVFKVELQEFVQKSKLGSITYLSLSKKGPDHSPEFREAVLLNGKQLAEGKGTSKQLAQNKAAEVALKKIKKQGR